MIWWRFGRKLSLKVSLSCFNLASQNSISGTNCSISCTKRVLLLIYHINLTHLSYYTPWYTVKHLICCCEYQEKQPISSNGWLFPPKSSVCPKLWVYWTTCPASTAWKTDNAFHKSQFHIYTLLTTHIPPHLAPKKNFPPPCKKVLNIAHRKFETTSTLTWLFDQKALSRYSDLYLNTFGKVSQISIFALRM